jgi:hypothetical protein
MTSVDANNLGYYFLARKDFETARRLLGKASGAPGSPYPLALYNLAMLDAQCGAKADAWRNLADCLGSAEKLGRSERGCRCLVEPRVRNGVLEFEEIFGELDLLRTARRAKESLTAVWESQVD